MANSFPQKKKKEISLEIDECVSKKTEQFWKIVRWTAHRISREKNKLPEKFLKGIL